ncbi:hypothetical protein ColTof4_05580 [Colletotrichum tofieldiae]|nr:hypothetical protein ColTof3_00740 [Colletotrichum tofieldiae]GKT73157.1 hypothetical protein ColTof4_05580 [Colletotrichum tofieldiae]
MHEKTQATVPATLSLSCERAAGPIQKRPARPSPNFRPSRRSTPPIKDMIPTNAIVLLPLLASAVHGLQFTAPEAGVKLNLSAPIAVTWKHQANEADASWTVFDLWWHGDHASGGSFGYELGDNIPVGQGGQYEWDPASVREALSIGSGKLSSGKGFYFEAKLHPPNATAPGTSIQSVKYAVEDSDLVESSGNTMSPLWGLVVSSLAVSVALF